LPAAPPMPEMPEKCGHCSFKFRCRKRAKTEGCNPIDGEHVACDEHAGVCDMPKFPLHNLGCRYEFASMYLQQCVNRADLSEWKREGYRKMFDLLPHFHCSEVGEQCKCCCHPYEPSADGSTCERIHDSACEPFTPWNDWSDKCMWFPPAELKTDFTSHCNFQMPEESKDKAKEMIEKFKLPEGFEFPSRCGYCSFKVKCRSRPVESTSTHEKECFPLEIRKKACGPDDCETCGNTCELPKMMGSCNYTENLRKFIGPGLKSRMKKMPHGMRDGLLQMVGHLPHGKCIEKNDKCFCCCHPYEPNAAGDACVVKDICKNPDDLGIEIDMNMPTSFFFF